MGLLPLHFDSAMSMLTTIAPALFLRVELVFTAVSTPGMPSWEEKTGREHSIREVARLAND
jgi:hypothetical protein